MQAMEGEFSQKAFFLSPSALLPLIPRTLGPFPSSPEPPPPLLRVEDLREVPSASLWGLNHKLTRLCPGEAARQRKAWLDRALKQPSAGGLFSQPLDPDPNLSLLLKSREVSM